jgi:hypothetical protein
MANSPIFQTQIDRQHLLQSLLIALSFTSPLKGVYIQAIVAGFVKDAQDYVSNQKTRGWLIKQDGVMLLSEKAQTFVRLCQFNIVQSKSDTSKQTYHDLLLVRALFLCLLHLELEDILEIRKQKHYEPRFIPDLTIIAKNQTLLIEVETGRQSLAIVEAKIKGLLAGNPDSQKFILIYFTDSPDTYSYFTETARQYNVHFINLQSHTLAQDLLGLNTASTRTGTEFDFETDSGENLNVNTAAGSAKYSSPSHTSQTAGADSKFQPIELTNPITGQPVKKATNPLAPNVFVYDPNLAAIMQQPLPEAVKDTIKYLETANLPASEAEFERTITEALLLMEFEETATDEEDFDED